VGNTKLKYGAVVFAVLMVLLLVTALMRITLPMYAVAIIAIVAVACLIVPVLYVKRTTATCENGVLHVTGSNIDFSIPVDTIRTFEFRDSLTVGRLAKGSNNGWMAAGVFTNPEFGDYNITADTDQHAFIVVRFSGKVLVFNLRTEEETRTFYDSVKEIVPDNPRRR